MKKGEVFEATECTKPENLPLFHGKETIQINIWSIIMKKISPSFIFGFNYLAYR